MTAIDGLKSWATERPRIAALMAAGLLVLVAALMLLGRGGELPPVVGGVADPVAEHTPAADGTAVAQQEGPLAPAEQSAAAAVDASTPAAPSTAVSRVERDSAYASEQAMNDGLTPAPPALEQAGTAPVSTPVATSDDIAFAGRKLELVATKLDACLARGGKDIFDCLAVVPDGFEIVRIFDAKPQGAFITLTGSQVGISIRGGVWCRTMGSMNECNAWSTADV